MWARLEVRELPDRTVVAERKRGIRVTLALLLVLAVGAGVRLWKTGTLRDLDSLAIGMLIFVAGVPLALILLLGSAPRRTIELDSGWNEIRFRSTWMGLPLRQRRVDVAECRGVKRRCLDPGRQDPDLETLYELSFVLGTITLMMAACLVWRDAFHYPLYAVFVDLGEGDPGIHLPTRHRGDAKLAVEHLSAALARARR